MTGAQKKAKKPPKEEGRSVHGGKSQFDVISGVGRLSYQRHSDSGVVPPFHSIIEFLVGIVGRPPEVKFTYY